MLTESPVLTEVLQPLIILITLCWTCTDLLILPGLRTQSWTQYCRCGLTNLSVPGAGLYICSLKSDGSCWALPPDSSWQPGPPVCQLHLQAGIICQHDQDIPTSLPPGSRGLHRVGLRTGRHFPPDLRKFMDHNSYRVWSWALRTSCFMQNMLAISHTSCIFKFGLN